MNRFTLTHIQTKTFVMILSVCSRFYVFKQFEKFLDIGYIIEYEMKRKNSDFLMFMNIHMEPRVHSQTQCRVHLYM